MTARYLIIDTYLLYWGKVQRKDLTAHLGVGNVTATRIFSDYSANNPGALLMDPSAKAYVYTDSFTPITSPTPETVLPLMAYGVEHKQIKTTGFGPPTPSAVLAALCPEKVSAITRAMVSKMGVKISYSSNTSGPSERTVYPHALFIGGGAWYFRAFDAQSSKYRTFRFSRVKGVGKSEGGPEHSFKTVDAEWNSEITLTLAPHTKYKWKDALAMDLGLTDKPVSNLTVNKVMAGHVLTDLRVDCSPDASLNPNQYFLQLMNVHELAGVGSLKIAPGYVTWRETEAD
jgi:hypothetical protein